MFSICIDTHVFDSDCIIDADINNLQRLIPLLWLLFFFTWVGVKITWRFLSNYASPDSDLAPSKSLFDGGFMKSFRSSLIGSFFSNKNFTYSIIFSINAIILSNMSHQPEDDYKSNRVTCQLFSFHFSSLIFSFKFMISHPFF